jgi:hypothetical protein
LLTFVAWHPNVSCVDDVLCHTDLRRTSGSSFGTPLNRINLVSAYCSDCGSLIGQKKEMTVISLGCHLLCSTCRKAHHKSKSGRMGEEAGVAHLIFDGDAFHRSADQNHLAFTWHD